MYIPNKYLKIWVLFANVLLVNTVLNIETLSLQLVLSIAVYFIGKDIGKGADAKRPKRKLVISIIVLVVWFAFRNYIWHGDGVIQRLGMSYILFRHIQYLVDSYKCRIKSYNLIDFINFILFFPNFLAGPIDKYTNFKRWSDRNFNRSQKALVLPGLGKIGIGIIKKYAFVPFIITYATDYHVLSESMGVFLGLGLSLIAYSAYIYLDFSGYSDIAIGTGYLMGIRTPENFRSPYLSTDLSAFWKRWHITFSDFLRDLIFIPFVKYLAKKQSNWPRLLVSGIGYIVTFVLCGVWHGNTMNFIYWGLWHGIGLIGVKLWNKNVTMPFNLINNTAYNVLMMIVTFFYVTIGWMFFHYSHDQLIEIFSSL
tara:strand:- start:289 stop:1389 length:1101 start_codon:yes stop_codon:yes gene_type:complete